MRRYDIVLLDADNTLFDFNAAEAQALDAVLAEFGWPRDEGTKQTYLEINHALWSAFDRGEAEESFRFLKPYYDYFLSLRGDPAPDASR